MNFRKVFILFSILLPNKIKIYLYKKIFGWRIGKGVHIGLSYIDTETLKISDNVRIGNFNIIKNLKNLEIGENSNWGNLNRAAGNQWDNTWENTMIIGGNVDITSGHVFDVGGGVYINNNVTIAGIYSQFWSHEKSLEQNKFITKPLYIGSNVYIGSNALIAPGAKIPSNTIIGMGTVIPAKFKSDEGSLIVGNPPIIKKENLKMTQVND